MYTGSPDTGQENNTRVDRSLWPGLHIPADDPPQLCSDLSADTAELLAARFCSGYGQSDTHSPEIGGNGPNRRENPHPSAGAEYQTITLQEIFDQVESPPSVPKSEGQWIIPSNYAGADARTHSIQRESGTFRLLPLDVDTGNLSLEDVDSALGEVCGDVMRAIYSTSSAKPRERKWRALVALSTPLQGADYGDTVRAFNDLLGQASGGQLAADGALCRPGQLVYLPNRGDFYEDRVERNKPPLSLSAAHMIIDRRERNRAERAEIERQAAEDQAARKARVVSDGAASIVDAFNACHEIEDLFLQYGYEPECDMGGSDWRSPYQSSGSFATRDFGTHWISLSGSDAERGLGKETASGVRSGDAFDLYAHFRHGGDFTAAVRAYALEIGQDHGTQRNSMDPSDYFEALPDEAGRDLFFDAASLDGKPIPPREWVVDGLVPVSTVTLFSGDGGTGKSLLSLQLAVAVSTGTQWLGMDVRSGVAAFLSAEDDADELHRRLGTVAKATGQTLADMARLKVASLAGKDALLAAQDRGSVKPTALLGQIDAYLTRVHPTLLILDTSADLFGGDEIDRAQVRQFIGILRGLAIRHHCAVMLLSHPSVAGMGSGSGLSGSTAWNNSVRARLYLERVKEGKFEIDPNARRLSNKKSNYGPTGAEMMLRWKSGIFDLIAGGGQSLNAEAQANAQSVFLGLLRQFKIQGRTVNASSGANYAPSVFAEHTDAAGVTKAALREAMNKLLSAGKIHNAEEGPPSKRRRYLAIVED